MFSLKDMSKFYRKDQFQPSNIISDMTYFLNDVSIVLNPHLFHDKWIQPNCYDFTYKNYNNIKFIIL